jgi:hypothetical protein
MLFIRAFTSGAGFLDSHILDSALLYVKSSMPDFIRNRMVCAGNMTKHSAVSHAAAICA